MTSSRAAQKAPRGQRNDAARMAFASWLVLPPSQREPKTQEELARVLGVTSPTLSAWRRLPVIQAVTSDWKKAYAAHFNELMDALWRRARSGNVQAIKLAAEILGELAPTKVEQTNIDGPFGQLLTELRDMRAKPLEVIDGGKDKKRA
jgi:transcriptional regulator with XRE-family HTH domain